MFVVMDATFKLLVFIINHYIYKQRWVNHSRFTFTHSQPCVLLHLSTSLFYEKQKRGFIRWKVKHNEPYDAVKAFVFSHPSPEHNGLFLVTCHIFKAAGVICSRSVDRLLVFILFSESLSRKFSLGTKTWKRLTDEA